MIQLNKTNKKLLNLKIKIVDEEIFFSEEFVDKMYKNASFLHLKGPYLSKCYYFGSKVLFVWIICVSL